MKGNISWLVPLKLEGRGMSEVPILPRESSLTASGAGPPALSQAPHLLSTGRPLSRN